MVFAISGKSRRRSVHFIFIAFSSPIGAVLQKHSDLDVLAPFNPTTEGFLRYLVKCKVKLVFCCCFFVYLFVCLFVFSGGGGGTDEGRSSF